MPPNRIVVSPSPVSVEKNKTQQFTAIGYDPQDNVVSVIPAPTWNATLGTVNNGLFTAPANPGAVIVTATSGNVTGSANVNVVEFVRVFKPPSFKEWWSSVKLKSLSLDPGEKWTTDAENYYKDRFFGANPINTDLSWTKDVLLKGYEVTMDTFKQILVALITAAFTALGSFYVISNYFTSKATQITNTTATITTTPSTTSVNWWLLAIIEGIILLLFILVYLRMQFITDKDDAKMTVVLEHNCIGHPNHCKNIHYPS